MRISDWSSDVCSSDLRVDRDKPLPERLLFVVVLGALAEPVPRILPQIECCPAPRRRPQLHRPAAMGEGQQDRVLAKIIHEADLLAAESLEQLDDFAPGGGDRKSTRLNSSH